MRIAALAFGVLAGLVASLILALGGLDPAALPQLDPRQMSLISFGLFIVANIGVLGAGIVLAAPLAGVILMLLGAVGWIVAALIMHHGPDFVMLTPPGLLLVAAILAAIAFVRRPRHAVRRDIAIESDTDENPDYERERQLALASARPLEVAGDEDDESIPQGVAVGASFFGNSGTATPLSGAMAPQARGDLLPLATDEEEPSRLGPIRRRIDPPRQKSVFVEPEEEYEDEESGFSRVARALSSILSFGLYAALAGAAVLIFWNLRTGDATRPTATRIEATESSARPTAPVLQPSSSAPPAKLAEAPAVSSLPPLLVPPAAPLLAGEATPSSTFGAPSSAAEQELSSALAAPMLGAAAEAAAISEPSDPFSAASSAPLATEPPPAAPAATDGTSALMPLAMPPQMAAARARPAPRPTPHAATAPTDTGL